MENYIALPTDRQKGKALRRRMREMNIIQGEFAKQIGYKSRGTISGWWKGQFWPLQLEAQIEQLLQVPPGFFSRIARGVKYEHALTARAPGAPLVVTSLSAEHYHAALDLLDQVLNILEQAYRHSLAQHLPMNNGQSTVIPAQDLGR